MTDIGGEWYIKNSEKLTPLRKQKLSKKPQEKNEKIKRNIQTANRNCNDWKFQIHWTILEWVNPIIKIVRERTYPTSSTKYYIDKDDRTSHCIGN